MSWQDDAACKGRTADMFPPRGENALQELARAICATCPVLEQCRQWVLENPQPYGVWAGMAGKEISEARKRAGIIRTGPVCGTRTKFVAGCRCDLCRMANRENQRRVKRRQLANR
jgi:WhiB family redox-sensing transcriptional regulator